MTPQPQRWTILAVVRWVVVGSGLCWCMVGICLAICPYEQAQDFALELVLPLLGLTNWDGSAYAECSRLHNGHDFISPAIGPGFWLRPRWVGWGMIATGLTMALIAGVLIDRARKKFATPIDPASVN